MFPSDIPPSPEGHIQSPLRRVFFVRNSEYTPLAQAGKGRSLRSNLQIRMVLILSNISAFREIHIEKSRSFPLFGKVRRFFRHPMENDRVPNRCCVCVSPILRYPLSKSRFLGRENPFLEAPHSQPQSCQTGLRIDLNL